MGYTPVVPLSGVAGWRFLQRTEATQKSAFDSSAEMQKDVTYFAEKIGSITSAADLVSDRRLLKVALGAFGLGDKIDAKAFIRKVLEDGDFASRLTDPAYSKLAAAFDFGNAGVVEARTSGAGFAAKITDAYKTKAAPEGAGDGSGVSADVEADVKYFAGKIGKITSAAELVADQRLLKVALGAFGLGDKIGEKAFIRQLLEQGTEGNALLAARRPDPAYAKLVEAFGFADTAESQTASPGFAAKITEAYKTNAFQQAVGEVSDTMRLAMNFRDQIGELSAGSGKSWYVVLGSKPLREVFEGAFGLPRSFVNLDIDVQRDVLAEKASQLFGGDTLATFQDPEAVEKVLNRFLVRRQLDEGVSATSRGAAALTLLQSGSSSGSQGILNLLSSMG